MPTVTHVKKYEKKLLSDAYQIRIPCCEELREVNPKWRTCPYCGQEITIEELQEVVVEV